MNKTIATILGLIVLGLIIFYFVRRDNGPSAAGDNANIVCTMDAKLCPDGSYVGREGPNCEFRACPGADTDEEVIFDKG